MGVVFSKMGDGEEEEEEEEEEEDGGVDDDYSCHISYSLIG